MPQPRSTLNEVFARMPRDEALALYERQTTYVHTVLDRGPELLNVLTKQEQKLFTRYFLPDWMEVGHFVNYYTKIEQDEPSLVFKANRLLVVFMDKNRLVEPDVLPKLF